MQRPVYGISINLEIRTVPALKRTIPFSTIFMNQRRDFDVHRTDPIFWKMND